MKNPFKQNRKPVEPKPEPTRPEMAVLVVPKALADKGFFAFITTEGAHILEPEGPALERLGRAVTVLYDPEARRYTEPAKPWVVRSSLDYTYKGQCFGVDGPALVKGIGLEFPNVATPWASGVEVEEAGALAWRRSTRPDAKEIVQVVEEAQRQVERIMKHYGETKEILAVIDKAAAK